MHTLSFWRNSMYMGHTSQKWEIMGQAINLMYQPAHCSYDCIAIKSGRT